MHSECVVSAFEMCSCLKSRLEYTIMPPDSKLLILTGKIYKAK